jgi:hypothetical protein
VQLSYFISKYPFGYIHKEEQYVTNPSNIILLGYPFTNSDPSLPKKILVATYELNYKKEKGIAIRLYSYDKISNILIDSLIAY